MQFFKDLKAQFVAQTEAPKQSTPLFNFGSLSCSMISDGSGENFRLLILCTLCNVDLIGIHRGLSEGSAAGLSNGFGDKLWSAIWSCENALRPISAETNSAAKRQGSRGLYQLHWDFGPRWLRWRAAVRYHGHVPHGRGRSELQGLLPLVGGSLEL